MVEAVLIVFLLLILVAALLMERSRRRRAEKETEQTREHLAHLSRVSALGELTVSLAHEINQPLTAILLNAQAASHLLSSPNVEVKELQAILQDIVDDDLRASEVIVRIRELASHHSTERIPVGLNELVQDVTKLVNKNLLLRKVSLDVNLASHLVAVEGDRIQLKQVVLNLLLNAFEAVSTSNRVPGAVSICTEMSADRLVHVIVRDNGSGLRSGTERKVFEPFYTTKESGMGMGLSIAQSIIESHGGNIWANPKTERGAEFHFTLPALNAKAHTAGISGSAN